MYPSCNYDLQHLNTLAVPAVAEFFWRIECVSDLEKALLWAAEHAMSTQVLGGGSNVIVAPKVNGLLLGMGIKGREILEIDRDRVALKVGAGENWHDLVGWTLSQNIYGLENLALIPGTVGAAPVQNIGAYGVEVAHVIRAVEGVYSEEGRSARLEGHECEFDYRDSVFKHRLQHRFIITHVIFELSLIPKVEISYPALREQISSDSATPLDVYETVCRIRSSKLPDPNILPNSGSFFKNPIVSKTLFESLIQRFPNMPFYPVSDIKKVKLAAAWLIEQAGLKGEEIEGVIVHDKQALVLTNPRRLNADAIYRAAECIQLQVKKLFDVDLELEPQPIS
jgi:UDP-N-acetylmuramate dehydrogenase